MYKIELWGIWSTRGQY